MLFVLFCFIEVQVQYACVRSNVTCRSPIYEVVGLYTVLPLAHTLPSGLSICLFFFLRLSLYVRGFHSLSLNYSVKN